MQVVADFQAVLLVVDRIRKTFAFCASNLVTNLEKGGEMRI